MGCENINGFLSVLNPRNTQTCNKYKIVLAVQFGTKLALWQNLLAEAWQTH
jgi:hypothetical protein